MADFKFSPIPRLPFVIENEAGEVIKEYSLDVGSDSFFRAIMDKGMAVSRAARGLTTGETSYDEMTAILREFVDFAFDKSGEYDALFKLFNRNIYAMIELSVAVCAKGQAAIEDRKKVNTAVYGG